MNENQRIVAVAQFDQATTRPWIPADGDTRCQECGRLNPVWWASNDDWNRIMGGPEAKGDPGGVLCPTCYHYRWLADTQARMNSQEQS